MKDSTDASRPAVPAPRELAASARFRAGLEELARRSGRHGPAVARDAARHLHELRSSRSPWASGLFVRASRALCGAGYQRIHFDPAELESVRAVMQRHPTIVLSSHRSYLDGGALISGFHDHDLPPLTGFSGINLAFWPLGAIWRRAGVVFIRRGGDDPVYRYVLRQYLGHLAERRVHLTWFLEGTRSRTGKLGAPKLGLLRYALDAWREGRADDLVLIPVSISYEELHEVEEFAGEARGAGKQKESLGWLVRYVRAQRGRYGTIYVRFGEPLALQDRSASVDGADGQDAEESLRRIALECSRRIAEATPITGAALVSLTLLGARGAALTLTQFRLALQGYLRYARVRHLPLAPTAALDDDQGLSRALDALRSHGVVTRYADGPQLVYGIGDGQHLTAAYYRNSIVHYFLDTAIAEVALLSAAETTTEDRHAAFDSTAFALRDLLKFDFFFADRASFKAGIHGELDRLAPDWRRQLALGTDGTQALLQRMPILTSDMILRSFVEAYAVVADELVARTQAEVADGDALLTACMGRARQYLLQRRLRNPESLSRHLFRTGLQLARHRGLLEPGAHAARRVFADELWSIARLMDTVSRIAVQRVEAMVRDAER